MKIVDLQKQYKQNFTNSKVQKSSLIYYSVSFLVY